MKKFLLSLVGMFLFTGAVSAQSYWYVSGEFNNYNPNGLDQWALIGEPGNEAGDTYPEVVYVLGAFNDYKQSEDFVLNNLEETEPEVLGNILTIPAGEFKFYINYNGQNYGPAQDADTNNGTSKFEGTYAESNGQTYWTYSNWPGGSVDVTVDVDTKAITLYLSPKQSVATKNYTSASFEDGIISLGWEDCDQVVTVLSEGAYVTDGTKQTPLTNRIYNSSLGEYEGNIANDFSTPGIKVYLSDLNLSAGNYTLVIPEGYLDIDWDDYESNGTNPPINYQFTIGANGLSLNTLGAAGDDETSGSQPGVFTGSFNVPAGQFKFNLINPDGFVFVPMDEDMDYATVQVNFVNNSFQGQATMAFDDDDELYFWVDNSWPGGKITVSVDTNVGQNPTVTITAYPDQTVYNEDYNIQNFDGVISIYWDSEAISKLSYEEGEAYITDPSGEESVLDSKSNLVSFFGSNPFGIEFNIKYLDLSAGKYTLTVPAKFVAIQGSTSSEVSYNPEITYEFTISETTGIDSILNIDNNSAIYNLQGVKMPNDLNKLNRGVYIINGKKVMINK